MSLKLEIFLPKETVHNLSHLEELITNIGDLVGTSFGNVAPEDDFELHDLKSFIIIKDDELPLAENFANEDMYLVIPIESEE